MSQPNSSSAMYDFIIVGAGASGCTLAWQLATREQGFKILLLESGGSDDDKDLKHRVDGDRWITKMNPERNYNYRTEPQQHLDGRVIEYDRGKGIGGSTSINFCVYTVGAAGDYDRLAEMVDDDAFKWENVVGRLRQLETYHADSRELPSYASAYLQPKGDAHGDKGPLHIGFPRSWEPALQMTLDVCKASGMPMNLDMNSGNPIGVGMAPNSAHKGLRSTAADVLRECKEDIEILADATVSRLIFDKNNKCIGVETPSHKYMVKHEVILSCGSLDTPKVLMHSGIGSSEQLKKFGIQPRSNLPGVGQNLRDHHHLFVTWERASHTSTRPQYFRDQQLQAQARAQWAKDRTGPLADVAVQLVQGWLKSDNILQSPEFATLPPQDQQHLMHETVPHIELMFNPANPEYYIDPHNTPALFTAGAVILNEASRGSCVLQSSDPSVPLKFDPNFFSHPYDKRVAIEGGRAMLKFAEHPDFAKDSVRLWHGPKSDSDEDILAFWRENTISTWHMSGTVSMGKKGQESACVDSNFMVRGVEGLRVVDLSVVPFVMNCHTQSVAYCMGLVAAEKIATQYRSK